MKIYFFLLSETCVVPLPHLAYL